MKQQTKSFMFLFLIQKIQVFGGAGTRLMCWLHVNRQLRPRLMTLKKSSGNNDLAKEVLEDIEIFQWIVSVSSFEVDFKSLEEKYLVESESTEKEQEALEEFFGYFREQWGPDSKVKNWFERWKQSRLGGEERGHQAEPHIQKKSCGWSSFPHRG